MNKEYTITFTKAELEGICELMVVAGMAITAYGMDADFAKPIAGAMSAADKIGDAVTADLWIEALRGAGA